METKKFEITFTRADGTEDHFEETFSIERREKDCVFRTLRKDGSVDTFGYCDTDEKSFTESWGAIKRRTHLESEKFRAENAAAAKRLEEYDAGLSQQFRAIVDSFVNADEICKVAREAVEWEYVTLEELRATLAQPTKTARKIIRLAFSAAKAQAREEFEDEYRDAEEKEDFYNDHEDDVAKAFGENLF